MTRSAYQAQGVVKSLELIGSGPAGSYAESSGFLKRKAHLIIVASLGAAWLVRPSSDPSTCEVGQIEDTSPRPRRIVLLSDGTENSAAKVWRTRVWRMSCALDLAGDVSSRLKMSASLIGRLGSSTFRLSTSVAVSVSLAGSCFSSDSAPGPFHHGIRRRGGTILSAALPSYRQWVQADIRTHLIHRPARDIIPPLGGARFSSYSV